MTRLIKGPIRRLTGPARRVVARKLAAVVSLGTEPLTRSVVAALHRYDGADGPLRVLTHEVHVARLRADSHAADTNLLLDSLVREVARLQRQVEGLRREVEDLSAPRDGLAMAGSGAGETGF